MAYPNVDPQPDFPALERTILDRWERDETFEASIAQREAGENGENEFVFYDGPPFANGLPHYGHLLTGYVKDAIPRYQTMRGKRVERRFGWDCHGLPAEVKAEQELGISGHPEIAAFGIDKFNDACRASVLQYTDDWRSYVTRQARWVDFDNDYKTLDLSYMESVMWAFKTLHDKGLIYEGFRVLAYCWRCETPLSNTETRMDDTYQDRQDPALTVGFELDTGEKVLAWTTTPWTLPSNLALAVGPDIDYVVAEQDGQRYIIAEALLPNYAAELGEAEIVERMKGTDLLGRRYTPLFDYFADATQHGTEQAFQIIAADFVSVDDGTGIVHMAPGFGEDDQIACNEAGIPTLCPMDEHGQYTAEISDYVGRHVFDANPDIIRALKDRGSLAEGGPVVRHATYDHSYPHCWRCAEPLVYRAVSSWFVEVTKFRDRMVELNEQITWQPAHIKEGSFGKWIANARDWAISRNRFWGSPIPVWKSDNPDFPRLDVYGSLEQLQADFGVEVTDLHRPTIDDLVRPNPDDPSGESMMRRVPEVLDCWFESGSMPFAQVHYPFENTEWFENHYPGDFIVEYIGQTRGWFYTLHVLATALFDRPAFSSCVSHGIVLGDDGQKMSKSLNNYPDPVEMFDSHGADAMRWHLLSSSILRGSDGMVTEAGMRETVRQVLLPLWNSWYFLTLYANAGGHQGTVRTDSTNVLDRYILAKTRDLTADMTESMDAYDLFGACQHVRTYLDVLTNWYVRRSRSRFWEGDHDAIDTLHTVLSTLTRLAAPLLPFISEAISDGLHGDESSVHLADWPAVDELPADDELVASMDLARDVCSSTLSVRKAHQRRVRLPLSSVTVASPDAERLADFAGLIADEVNVRHVELTSDVSSVASEELKLVPAKLGPRLGKDVQTVIKAHKQGDWSVDGDVVVVGGVELVEGEYTLEQVASDDQASTGLGSHAGVVALDIVVTPELELEGRARDLVRLVQQARRDADLHVSDRIDLTVTAGPEWIEALDAHEGLVASETLSTSVTGVADESAAEPVITVAVAS
ncbi:isoleucine--tRNA ligase [Ilumatobacter coccineus]|uniref:Isoleucine--tRNA ligase n=1 Tax=Ilumatobacter coccineus (strain NBRC 103263 / KCTC 29153 / YM16-304) TaxID=1313172 RepID=A0A6C7EAN4_ILUCY|nr:isoleucine--tRNA ligase [Ilumatobacter coccineus]BAN02269.1 isoleucyl-tRNA synthetase [Ilumatobacter coccineus YM16-304]